MNTAAYQGRVVAEKAELDARILKLGAFLDSPEFPDVVRDAAERAVMRRQFDVMQDYSSILGWRIASFIKE